MPSGCQTVGIQIRLDKTSSLIWVQTQGSHRLEKYLNLEGFLEKSLKIKSALKSTGKSLKSLEKSSISEVEFEQLDQYFSLTLSP